MCRASLTSSLQRKWQFGQNATELDDTAKEDDEYPVEEIDLDRNTN